MAVARNAHAYGERWRGGKRLVRMRPHLWRELSPALTGGRVLEIGAGLRPTAPPRGSYFTDVSPEALALLQRFGGHAFRPTGNGLPFEPGTLDGVLAFEVLEHVPEDEALLRDIARALRRDGILALSVPLHMRHWSRLDDLAAHVRRYDPDDLFRKLETAGFRVDRYAPRWGNPNPVLDRLGAGLLFRFPRFTNGFLQRVGFPIMAMMQRAFGRMRWLPADAPVPERATGICLVATRR